MVAQRVKNLPVMWETEFNPWVGKKGMATRSVFFSGESHGPRSLAGYSALVCEESDVTEWLHCFSYFLNGVWRSVEEKQWTGSELYFHSMSMKKRGGPGSSARKESPCNAGDPDLTSGSGRTPGEGTGYSWASLVAQTVKNLPAVQETWVWSLGWDVPLEEDMATHSSILAWRIPWTEEPGGLQFVGITESDVTEWLSTA